MQIENQFCEQKMLSEFVLIGTDTAALCLCFFFNGRDVAVENLHDDPSIKLVDYSN